MHQPSITQEQIENILKQLERGNQIRKKLSGHGKLRIEKPIPYLLIYRNPTSKEKQAVKLVLGEISYLVTGADENHRGNVALLIQQIAKNLSKAFGAFMVIELWVGEAGSRNFKIKSAKDKAPATVEKLKSGLLELRETFPGIDVIVETTKERHPSKMEPILTLAQCQEAGCFLIGIEVPPVFKNDKTKEFYPIYFRTLKTRLSQILRQAIYEFLRVQTTAAIQSYHMLGSSSLGPAVWHVDNKLAAIEATFQFLLLISPINTQEARQKFQQSNFQKNPEFLYRILPIDPDYLKEKLYNINISNIDDPTLAYLFRDKREELEKKITMLRERGTKDFMYSSIRLYKAVDKELLRLAREILDNVPPKSEDGTEWVDCYELAERARQEIEWYRSTYPKLDARVEIKHDVIGIMVSQGQVLIGETFKTPKNRVDPLIHHEVGTHVLTYYNGAAQPLQQLSTGFADYDELQEGLAVLSEYLVGGITRDRIRMLAARVVAAHALTEGADFVETFRELHENYGFELETAFDVTARIHQGGGCTKDIIYLRGLVHLLNYLQEGGDIEPLFVGKIATKHIPIMEELKLRKVLRPVPMIPRYLLNKNALSKLDRVKNGLSLTELIQE